MIKRISFLAVLFIGLFLLSGCNQPLPRDEARDLNNSATEKIAAQNYQGALQDLDKAIGLNPYNPTAYLNRAGVRQELKDYKGAIEDYDKCIKMVPDSTLGYGGRATAKYDSKDYKGAILDFSKIIELDSEQFLAYYYRGSAKAYLEDTWGSIDDFTKAIDLSPNDARLYGIRGAARSKVKDYQGALQDFDEAIRLDQDIAYIYFFRGSIKHVLKDYMGAISDYNKAIELDPNGNAEVYSYKNNAEKSLALGNITLENRNSCNIKGNISYNGGEKIYHVPGCDSYEATVIAPSKGERWFCSEQEARNAGWRKAYNCP